MTTQEVANRLVELCRIGQIDQAQAELFADDATSIEPNDMMGERVVRVHFKLSQLKIRNFM